MENKIVLGIDIGGSHITAAMIDLNTRCIIDGTAQRKSVDSNGAADEILDSWCKVIDYAFTTLNISQRKIGIAMPGPLDYEAGISLIQDQEKFRSLYQLNLKEELGKRLSIEPEDILFINDAAAFLQGEVFCGAAINSDRVLGLTLGTGLGAAISIDGEAQDAALWNSSFKDGIAEDYLSTRWFLNSYSALTGKRIRGVKEITESRDFPGTGQKLFDEFAINLAAFIRSVAATNNIEVIVLGGNISRAYPFFLPRLNQHLMETSTNVMVKIAVLNEQAALIGAASCLNNVESARLANNNDK